MPNLDRNFDPGIKAFAEAGYMEREFEERPQHADSGTDDIRIGYQAAISMWTYEGTLIWSKYNAMLVANSIILAVVGLSANSKTLPAQFGKILAVAGLLLCVLWGLLLKRGFDTYVYWIMSARELEEKYLHDAVRIVSRGGHFSDGSEVDVSIAGMRRHLRMSATSRAITAAQASYLIIGVFAAIYFFLLVRL